MIIKNILGTADVAKELRKQTSMALDTAQVEAYTASIQGMSVAEAQATLTKEGLTAAQQAQVISSGVLATEKVKEAATTIAGSEADGAALLTKISFTDAELAEDTVTKKLVLSKIEHAVASGTVTAEEGKQLVATLGLTSGMESLSVAENTASVSAGILNIALTTLEKHPALKLFSIIAAIAGVVSLAIKKTRDVEKESAERRKKEYEDAINSLDDLNSKLKENKDRIEELNSLENLTYVQKSELDKLKETNTELERSIKLKKEIAEEGKYKEAVETYKTFDKDNADWYTGLTDSGNIKYLESNPDFSLKNYNFDDVFNYEVSDNLSEKLVSLNEYKSKKKELREKLSQKSLDEGMLDGFTNEDEARAYYESALEEMERIEKESEDGIKEKISKIDDVKNSMREAYEEAIKINPSDRTDEQKKVIENYSKLDDTEKLIYKYYDKDAWNDSVFNDIINFRNKEDKDKLLKIADRKNMLPGKNGTGSIEEYINSNKELLQLIEDSDIIPEDGQTKIDSFINQLKALSEKEAKLKTNPKSFITKWDELSSEFNDTKESLIELAKSGEITEDVLKSNKDYAKLLDNIGLSASEGKEKILSLLSATERLSGAQNVTDKIKNAYKEWKEKGFVTASTLEGMPDVLKKMNDGKDFDIFKNIVGDPTKSEDEIQSAFNKIITEYIKDQNVLGKLTKETQASYVANLKEMHVTNAKEVTDSMIETTSKLDSLTKEYLNYIETGSEESLKLVNQYSEELVKAGGSSYKTDLDNYKELLKNKGKATLSYTSEVYKMISNAMKTSPSAPKFGNSTNNPFQKDVDKITGFGLSNNAFTIKDASIRDTERLLQELYDDLNLKLNELHLDFDGFNLDGLDSNDPTKFDWIETLLSRVQRNIDNFGKKVSAVYRTWSDRNSAIKGEITELNNLLSTQSKASDAYLAKANSVGLNGSIAEKIRNGSYSIDEYTDDKLIKQINEYKDYYEKYLEALDAEEDTRTKIADAYKQEFDMIAQEYDSKIGVIESKMSLLDAFVSQQEAKGHIVGTTYYEALIDSEKTNIDYLTKKYDESVASFNEKVQSGKFIAGTEQYEEARKAIYDMATALAEANNKVLEYKKNIREINKEIFERQMDGIQDMIDEFQFYLDYMDNHDNFNSDTGAITEYGQSKEGIHSVLYKTRLAEAEEYAKRIEEINKEIANTEDGKHNKDLLDERKELIKSQRDAILSANSEKNAIIDLIKEGYDALINALDKVSSKYKENMQAQKDLYDYEKNIAEKTKSIASYQKQLTSLSGDDSEETQSKIQKIKVDLENAKTDLEETERDQWMSDQEKMLDKFKEDAQDWMDNKINELKEDFSQANDILNSSIQAVPDKIKEISDEANIALSTNVSTIIDNLKENSLNSINRDINGTTNKIEELFGKDSIIYSAINSIKSCVTDMAKHAEEEAKSKAEAISKGQSGSSSTSGTVGSSGTASSTPTYTPSKPSQSAQSQPKWGSWFISKKDYYPKSKLDKENSIVDRLKLHDFDSSFSALRSYYAAMGKTDTYRGTASQNIWMLNQMKAHGYYKGSHRIGNNQNAWTQERGQELIYRSSDGAMLTPLRTGDKVFTAQMSENLWNLAKMPSIATSMPVVTSNGNSGNTSIGDINIALSLPGVTNYEEFKTKLKTDTQLQKTIQDITIGAIKPGNNSLGVFRR